MTINNINYQKRVKIIAQDLDFRSVYMTYIQLSLVGARAKVVQGDTLTEPDTKDKNCIFYTRFNECLRKSMDWFFERPNAVTI